MSTPDTVFVGRLAGLAVFDQVGDPVGMVRDVVAIIPAPPRTARAVGLLVEVAGRRRIFLRMARVTGLSSTQVIVSGGVTLARFAQRPTETLLLGELRGRTAHHTPPQAEHDRADQGEPLDVIVEDVAIVRDPSGEWRVPAYYVRRATAGSAQGRGRAGFTRRLTRLAGRRPSGFIVPASELDGLVMPDQRERAANLRVAFDELRAADLADVVHELTPARRLEVLTTLDIDRLADVLEELSQDDQLEIVAQLGVERVADVLEAMQPDDAADLLGELPEEQSSRLLSLMDPDEADDVRRLLAYDQDSAGGLMTSEPVIVAAEATVAEALARVRRKDLTSALAAGVFVCKAPLQVPTGRYLGYVHLQRLLREPPGTAVGGLVDESLDPVPPGKQLTAVARRLASYNLVALAVTDSSGRLIGAITVDDVLDHLLPQDWRDVEDDDQDEIQAQEAQSGDLRSAEQGSAHGQV